MLRSGGAVGVGFVVFLTFGSIEQAVVCAIFTNFLCLADKASHLGTRLWVQGLCAALSIGAGAVGVVLAGNVPMILVTTFAFALFAGFVHGTTPGVEAIPRYALVCFVVAAFLPIGRADTLIAVTLGMALAMVAVVLDDYIRHGRRGVRIARMRIAVTYPGPRFSMVYGAAAVCGLAIGLFWGQTRPYWVTLTTILVMQPDRRANTVRVLQRFLGTLAARRPSSPSRGRLPSRRRPPRMHPTKHPPLSARAAPPRRRRAAPTARPTRGAAIGREPVPRARAPLRLRLALAAALALAAPAWADTPASPPAKPAVVSTTSATLCGALEAAAKRSGLPYPFFTRLIWQESRFDPMARSPAGAQGVAQFMPGTAAERGLADPFEPARALDESAAYLKELRQRFGNLGLAAAAYNAGPGRVGRWLAGTASLPTETIDYVEIVTGHSVEDWRGAKPPALAPEPGFTCLAFAGSAGHRFARATTLDDPSAPPPKPWATILVGSFNKAAVLAEWQIVRAKFAETLGPLTPSVRRRSFGEAPARKYVVQIESDSRAASNHLCRQLENGGGNCVVLRNILR